MLDKLQEALNWAHSQHVYKYDRDQYKINEYWTPNLVGDCEDFALALREHLKNKYDINSDLVFCGVNNSLGDHLVCSVEGWILDNRYKWVYDQKDSSYTWISLGNMDGVWKKILNN